MYLLELQIIQLNDYINKHTVKLYINTLMPIYHMTLENALRLTQCIHVNIP